MKHLFTEMDALFFVQIIISLAIGGVILLLIKVAASRFVARTLQNGDLRPLQGI